MNRPAIVLVVDDSAANRQLLRELLAADKYRVLEAADGPAALQLATETSPDLVLLDVRMPTMDGYEVCRRLRADPQLAEVPVILLTSLDDRASRLAGIKAGADDFISKPFNQVELRARVRTITRLNRYRRLMETQAELREDEQWLKAIFDQAAVGVAQTDATTKCFVRCNQRFCDLLGYTPAEMARLSQPEITHPQDLGPDVENLERLCNGTIREYTREKRYVRKDGSFVWASVAVSGIGATGVSPTAFIAVVLDITERKRRDEHFLQAQKMEALGQFSGGIAHDFNNILGAIIGYTELTRICVKGNPLADGHLEAVLQGARRAVDLVRQILAFSRQQEQHLQVVQLRDLVAEPLKLLRGIIPATIDFDVSSANDLPAVLADATQIHQVVMNLGTNAGHAMKGRPGRLGVRLENFTVDALVVGANPGLKPGPHVRLTVSDTGLGMDRATQARIFEPFFTTKGPGKGTGLGLSVVHGIMQSHHGIVTVNSEPGVGTTFHLYFPAATGEAGPTVAPTAEIPVGQGQRVLFVDDEVPLALLGKRMLEELGYAVVSTTSGADALAATRADPDAFDLVITDLTMPGMTGTELARQLREIRPGLPVILATGHTAGLTAARLGEDGIAEMIRKPLTLRLLGRALHGVLAPPPP
jgi:PAS domain S-box-containing protein